MFNSILRRISDSQEITRSELYDEDKFYKAFLSDIKTCQSEIIIESGFMTTSRVKQLLPVLEKLRMRNVKILINTRDPEDHSERMVADARKAASFLQHAGICVIYTKGQHRKTAVIDREILWEGSLNILSQRSSSSGGELMRRTKSVEMAWRMVRFLGLGNRAI